MVAITGSAGKTTTKEITAEFLGARYRVFRNKGNLNNHIGLPLSLLELRSQPEIAVVELGMNHPGEIRTLIGIAEPEVRVWTNVGDAHMGFFESADAIADAKAEILEQAGPVDVLVANADDPRVITRASRFPGRVITFAVDKAADVRARGVRMQGLEGTLATVSTPGRRRAAADASAWPRESRQRPRGNGDGRALRRSARCDPRARVTSDSRQPPRRAAAAARRHHAHRRFVQLEPRGAEARARTGRRRRRERAQDRRARRDARARRAR